MYLSLVFGNFCTPKLCRLCTKRVIFLIVFGKTQLVTKRERRERERERKRERDRERERERERE